MRDLWSSRVHRVVQFLLLVLWVVVLVTDDARSVRSQSCSNPPYLWQSPLRNFWNPNSGNITVKIDELFKISIHLYQTLWKEFTPAIVNGIT